MDTVVLIVVGVLAIAAIGATLYALNRSWGDFGRSPQLPPTGSSAPATPGADSWGLPERLETVATPPDGAAVPPGDLVPIVHPLVRRSAEQALGRGGPVTRYIVRRGDQLFFDFSQIEDPARRQHAAELMRRFNANQDVDIRAMMQLVQELFRQ